MSHEWSLKKTERTLRLRKQWFTEITGRVDKPLTCVILLQWKRDKNGHVHLGVMFHHCQLELEPINTHDYCRIMWPRSKSFPLRTKAKWCCFFGEKGVTDISALQIHSPNTPPAFFHVAPYCVETGVPSSLTGQLTQTNTALSLGKNVLYIFFCDIKRFVGGKSVMLYSVTFSDRGGYFMN